MLLRGTQYLDVEQKVNWNVSGNVGSNPVSDQAGAIEGSLTNWDALIGLRGRFAFGANNSWFVPYYFDMGAGNSDLTWQGIVGLGYAFHWDEIMTAWRYLLLRLAFGKGDR